MALRITAAALGAAVLGLATGWPVLALAGAVAGWQIPQMVTRRQAERQHMQRAVGLIEFIELLADMLEGSGQGLEAVVRSAAQVAPRSVRRETEILATELGGRVSMAEALAAFAEVMADPICDQLVMAFRLGESEQLSRVLRSVAAGGRAEVDLRRRVDASRSGVLWTGRMIIGLTIAIALLLAVVDRTYVAPYATPGGQLLLLAVVGIMALSIWAMDRVGRTRAPRRLLAPGETPQ
jgi:Flp pilus assembly protein TadB